MIWNLQIVFALLTFQLTNILAEDWLNLREKLISNLENYVEELQTKTSLIFDAVDEMQTWLDKSKDDPEKFLSNPLNAFSLIRRMHMDWTNWELYMEEPVGQKFIDEIEELSNSLPTKAEFANSLRSMQLLQKNSGQKADDLANGVIHGKQFYSIKLNPVECFTLGMQYFNDHNFTEANNWFETASKAYNATFSDVYDLLGVPRTSIYQMQAKSLLNLNNPSAALDSIEDGLKILPYDSKLLRMRIDIQMRLRLEPEFYNRK